MVKVKELLSSLKLYNVQFIIIGGQAAVLQGSAYITADIDICYSRNMENLENIVKAITPFHPYLRGGEKNLPFIFDAKTLKMGLNFTFTTDIGDIDLIGEVRGIGEYDKVIKFSETMEIYGMDFQVLTIDGLLISKKALNRPKDIPVIKELEAIKQIQNP